MAGNSPRTAVQAFFEPLQQVVSCFSSTAHLAHKGPYTLEGGPYALLIDRFRLPGLDLYLAAAMNYRIVEASGDHGPYKVKTTAYQYVLETEEQEEIISYQWHPESKIKFPHLHLGSSTRITGKTLKKLHLPTGRIALEQVLKLAVDDLQAKPRNDQWDSILAESQKRFEKWRTWG